MVDFPRAKPRYDEQLSRGRVMTVPHQSPKMQEADEEEMQSQKPCFPARIEILMLETPMP